MLIHMTTLMGWSLGYFKVNFKKIFMKRVKLLEKLYNIVLAIYFLSLEVDMYSCFDVMFKDKIRLTCIRHHRKLVVIGCTAYFLL